MVATDTVNEWLISDTLAASPPLRCRISELCGLLYVSPRYDASKKDASKNKQQIADFLYDFCNPSMRLDVHRPHSSPY